VRTTDPTLFDAEFATQVEGMRVFSSDNMQSTALFAFIRWFVESGCWWYSFGAILLHCQLFTVVSLAAASLVANNNNNNNERQDGLLTVLAVERGCALSNAVAFASFWVQFRGLIGENGLSPAKDIVQYYKKLSQRHDDEDLAWREWLSYYFLRFPTVFWVIPCTDTMLHRICGGGFILSLSLVFVPSLPTPITTFAWWMCGWLYLSLIHVSGDFLGLQSDSNLVEIDALLGLLCLIQMTHPKVALVSLRFFAFRKMLGCGICKWYGSTMWQELSSMTVHYYTQPLPNRLSYYAHHLPLCVHQLSVVGTFVVEIIMPYLIFVPHCRYVAWFSFNALNLAINTTGNYGFIGFLNTCENLSLTDDGLWRRVLSSRWFGRAPAARLLSARADYSDVALDDKSWTSSILLNTATSVVRMVVAVVLVIYLAVSSLPTLSRASRGKFTMDDFIEAVPRFIQERLKKLPPKINQFYKRQHSLRLCNYQGKFGSMHDYRWECVVEGSRDGKTWRQYRWKFKLNKGQNECGRILPLHLPRLDWRVWFLPLYARRGSERPEWYYTLLEKLLLQQPDVVRLLAEDPFHGADEPPPRFIHSRVEEFTFAPKSTNRWWESRAVRQETPLDFLISRSDVTSKKGD
jgi:hypothetical protein